MDRKRYLKDYLKAYRAEVKCLNLTVPVDEYNRIEKAARREGKKPGRLIVDVALATIDRTVFVPASLQAELQALRFLIRNVANNLNQIAHHTNAVRKAADDKAVFRELERLERSINEYTSGRLETRLADSNDPLKRHLQAVHDHQIHES